MLRRLLSHPFSVSTETFIEFKADQSLYEVLGTNHGRGGLVDSGPRASEATQCPRAEGPRALGGFSMRTLVDIISLLAMIGRARRMAVRLFGWCNKK